MKTFLRHTISEINQDLFKFDKYLSTKTFPQTVPRLTTMQLHIHPIHIQEHHGIM